MRRYGDATDARRGVVGDVEATEQVVWKRRLWLVPVEMADIAESGTQQLPATG